jgi:hypothetical protein
MRTMKQVLLLGFLLATVVGCAARDLDDAERHAPASAALEACDDWWYDDRWDTPACEAPTDCWEEWYESSECYSGSIISSWYVICDGEICETSAVRCPCEEEESEAADCYCFSSGSESTHRTVDSESACADRCCDGWEGYCFGNVDCASCL